MMFCHDFQEAAEENDENDDEKVPQAAQQSEKELKRKVWSHCENKSFVSFHD
jgi:hypothetical protein